MVYLNMLYEKGGLSFNGKTAVGPCSVLNIGLGGVGIRSLCAVKKKIGEGSAEDGCGIKYLAVDNDRHDLRLMETNGAANVCDQCIFLNLPQDHNGVHMLATGCNRKNGRAALLAYRPELMHKIRVAINELISITDIPPVVNIYSGSGGGMGSGALIDLCYIVKAAACELGVSNVEVNVYLAMPDMYALRGMGNNVPNVATRIRANAYALLKELDFCMKLGGEAEGEWDVDCGYYHAAFSEPPAKACYLISELEANRTPASVDFYETVATHVAAEAFGNAAYNAANRFAVLGAASSGVDINAMFNYYVARAFVDMRSLASDEYTTEKSKAIVWELGLDFEQLCHHMLQDTDPAFSFAEEISWKNYKGNMDHNSIPDALIKDFDAHLNNKLQQLYNNKNKMCGMLSDEHEGLLACIKRKTEQLLCDPTKGPAYAAEFIGSTDEEKESVIGVVSYNIERLRWSVREAEAVISLSDKDLNAAIREFLDTSLFEMKRRRNFELLVSVMQEKYVKLLKRSLFEFTEDYLCQLRAAIVRYYDDKVKPCAVIFDKLANTFEKNEKALESLEDTGVRSLVTLSNVKELISNAEFYTCTNDHFKTFYEELYKNIELLNANEEKVKETVSSFFEELFSDYGNTSLCTFIQWKTKVSDHILIRGIYTAELDSLNNMAGIKFYLAQRNEELEESYVKLVSPVNDIVAANAVNNYVWHYNCPTTCQTSPLQELAVITAVFGYGPRDYGAIRDLYSCYQVVGADSSHLDSRLEELPELV